jgi:hypothetical protein
MSIDKEQDDDLGAFFEEVSAAEEEAKKEISNEISGDVGLTQETIIPHDLNSAENVGHSIPNGKASPPDYKMSHIGRAGDTKPISAVVIKREAVITTRRIEPLITTNLDSVTGGSTATTYTPFHPQPPSDSSAAASSASFHYLQHLHPHPYSSNFTNNPALGPIQQPHVVASHGTYPLVGEQQHETAQQQSKPKKGVKRIAAGKVWEDPSLAEWPLNDFRIFVGNLAKDVKNEQLFQHFHSKYPSVALARIVFDKNKNSISKGYGFVSFLDPLEAARAIREMNETFLGSRPIKVKKSDWKERDFNTVKKKHKKNTI